MRGDVYVGGSECKFLFAVTEVLSTNLNVLGKRVFKIPHPPCFQPPNKPHPLVAPAPSRGSRRGRRASGNGRCNPSAHAGGALREGVSLSALKRRRRRPKWSVA
jgi:hypothetical protein